MGLMDTTYTISIVKMVWFLCPIRKMVADMVPRFLGIIVNLGTVGHYFLVILQSLARLEKVIGPSLGYIGNKIVKTTLVAAPMDIHVTPSLPGKCLKTSVSAELMTTQ